MNHSANSCTKLPNYSPSQTKLSFRLLSSRSVSYSISEIQLTVIRLPYRAVTVFYVFISVVDEAHENKRVNDNNIYFHATHLIHLPHTPKERGKCKATKTSEKTNFPREFSLDIFIAFLFFRRSRFLSFLLSSDTRIFFFAFSKTKKRKKRQTKKKFCHRK